MATFSPPGSCHPVLQALALSWQKSSGLPAFNLSQSDYWNACLGCDPRENAVSFSPDGSIGVMTLPLQSPPALYRTLDGGRWAWYLPLCSLRVGSALCSII